MTSSLTINNHKSVALTRYGSYWDSSIWPWSDFVRSSEKSRFYTLTCPLIVINHKSVALMVGYWGMANWKFSRIFWFWLNLSRSSEILQVIHIDIISDCYNHKSVSLTVTEIWQLLLEMWQLLRYGSYRHMAVTEIWQVKLLRYGRSIWSFKHEK